ncbi:MAG: sterol desaturase family protein [Verrucomicrobia bacterium]|nr:sterol desaturase family protein [Verrucomicrobiota bacterium]MDA1066013.1 sterol desaturase family protein [Verrucomicrobiota bacterium]
MTKKVVQFSIYPTVIIGCFAVYHLLRLTELPIQLSTYIAVFLGAFLVTGLECIFPHRNEWAPGRTDVGSDFTFMVVVQIVLPKLLSFFVAITLLRQLPSIESLNGIWPHGWPLALQAVIMLATADLFRYLLHRTSHEWSEPLWRLHAVHHSPHKLYWLNVGRFHPIEKSIQFLLDALPFILLGVSEEVLALYFVFYAVNGFFQHCNIDVKLGLLNYLISGPELHRWHHSRLPHESNKNYGNNLIIWDVLFRSRYLPADREVQTLGLLNRDYPLDFLHQMQTPFIKGADQPGIPED